MVPLELLLPPPITSEGCSSERATSSSREYFLEPDPAVAGSGFSFAQSERVMLRLMVVGKDDVTSGVNSVGKRLEIPSQLAILRVPR